MHFLRGRRRRASSCKDVMPFKDDEHKRREISRKDAKSFSCPQILSQFAKTLNEVV